METEFQCQKCGEICVIDGDPPRFSAWCYECNDYAAGFDCIEYAGEHRAARIDDAMDRRKELVMEGKWPPKLL